MSKVPVEYRWLEQEPGPNILREALTQYGVLERPGLDDNPIIIGWADEVGAPISDLYNHDSIPWCGLFIAVCAKRAGKALPPKPLWALDWIRFGAMVRPPASAMLGDVLVFKRAGGGHVGLYVGEDDNCYHVLGGNQSDSVCITRIEKSRLYAVRRCVWQVAMPANVRRIHLSPNGAVSHNEQ